MSKSVDTILMNIYYKVKIKLNVKRFWKNILPLFIKSLVPVIIIFFITKLFELTGLYAFLIYGTIYVIIFMIFSYLISMNKYEKNIIKTIIKKVRRD